MSPQVIESEIDTQSLSKMLDYLCRDHRTIRTSRTPSPRNWHSAFINGKVRLLAGSLPRERSSVQSQRTGLPRQH